MSNISAEDRSERLGAIAILATLCPPGDAEETAIQIDLRDRLLSNWPTPILVEACMRLAKSWTWKRMPLPGDIDLVCKQVRIDCRRLKSMEKRLEPPMPLKEAQRRLAELESKPKADRAPEQIADAIIMEALKARIKLGNIPESNRLVSGESKS